MSASLVFFSISMCMHVSAGVSVPMCKCVF